MRRGKDCCGWLQVGQAVVRVAQGKLQLGVILDTRPSSLLVAVVVPSRIAPGTTVNKSQVKCAPHGLPTLLSFLGCMDQPDPQIASLLLMFVWSSCGEGWSQLGESAEGMFNQAIMLVAYYVVVAQGVTEGCVQPLGNLTCLSRRAEMQEAKEVLCAECHFCLRSCCCAAGH